MALIYGLVRAVAVAFAKLAAWRHARAQKQLETADTKFRKAESSCKADEVEAGRPADFASQFHLLKHFEQREFANERWKRAAVKMAKREKFANWLAEISGKKIPYSFGLVDMALAMKIVEWSYEKELDLTMVSDLIERFL